jgi:outer membrane protein
MNTPLRASAALAAALFAVPAFAQTAPAAGAAAARPSNPGPVIPGVCVLDEQRAVVTSAAGRAFNTRMQQLSQQVEAELRPQQTSLQTELTTYQSQQATLQPAQRQQREQALQTRANAFQTLASTRQRELQLTQETQLRRIATEMQPVVNQVYVQRGCGLMLDSQSTVYANPAMNVTDAVIAGLNTRLPTLTFNRSTAPAAPAGVGHARGATRDPALSREPARRRARGIMPDSRFYESLGPATVAELAALAGAELADAQDGARSVTGAAPLSDATTVRSPSSPTSVTARTSRRRVRPPSS